jgi:ATP-binding cassette subfamily F protein 3
VVSHDRSFLQGFATKIWRIGGGKVLEYDGGYDYYEWKSKQQQAEEQLISRQGITGKANPMESVTASRKSEISDSHTSSKTKEQKRVDTDQRNELNKQLKPLKQKAQKLEGNINELEKEKNALEKRLAAPEFYQTSESAEVVKRFGLLQQQIDALTEEWLHVLENLEQLESEIA